MPVYSYAKSFSFSVREVYCYQESKATKLIPSYLSVLMYLCFQRQANTALGYLHIHRECQVKIERTQLFRGMR